MLSNEYQVYVANNIALARSLCIKSQQTIEAMNSYLRKIGINLDYIDPSLFKYYVNLQGNYWKASMIDMKYSRLTLGDDVPMTFVCIETDSEVPFTKDSLLAYPISHSEFKEFGRYYKDLVERYPEQEFLIRRIINPITLPMNELIEIPDGTILHYDSRWIESNEISLIGDLQQWLNNYFTRWNLTGFQISDRLYPAAWSIVLYHGIVNALLNIRLEKIRTNEVHSFHLWNYLGGYFELDRFKEALTKEQALFLYRNIEHIVNNAGSKETLLFIYENMIKNYGLSLNTFEIRQDSSQLVINKKNEIVINKFPIDATNIVEYDNDVISVESFIQRIKNQAILNPIFMEEDILRLTELSLRTDKVNIATGVIECEREISAAEAIVSKVDERFNQLFYLALSNKFPYQFELSISDKKEVPVTTKQAVYILLFCADRLAKYRAINESANRLHNNGSTTVTFSTAVPNISVVDILTDPGKVYTDYVDAANNYVGDFIAARYLSEDLFNYITENSSDFLLSNLPNFTTIADFHSYVDSVISEKMKHYLTIHSEEDIYGSMQLQEMIKGNYYQGAIIFTPPWATWDGLKAEIDFDLDVLSEESLTALVEQIVKLFIGNITVREGLTSPYFEMMEILRILSSYMVTYISSDASGLIRPLQWTDTSLKLLGFTINYKFNLDVDVSSWIIDELAIDTIQQPDGVVYPQINPS